MAGKKLKRKKTCIKCEHYWHGRYTGISRCRSSGIEVVAEMSCEAYKEKKISDRRMEKVINTLQVWQNRINKVKINAMINGNDSGLAELINFLAGYTIDDFAESKIMK